MRILVDVAELEDLSRVFEDGTTELAGIAMDLRRRLRADLLDQVALYGFPTRGVAYDFEGAWNALVSHVGELERFTMDLERVLGEARGLVQEGQLAPGAASRAPNLWWFRTAATPSGAAESHAFAAAAAAAGAHPAAAAASPVVGAVVGGAVVGGSGSGDAQVPGAGPGTWEELDRYLLSAGLRINRPPEIWQTTGGVHATHSNHYRGRARDYSYGMGCDEQAIVSAFRPHIGSGIVELFHAATGTWYPSNVGGHRDHVHAAIAPGYRFTT